MVTTVPPGVPEGIDPKVAEYLRRLRTWAQNEFDNRATKTDAVSSVLFTAKGGSSVWSLAVDTTTGAVVTSKVPLGGGGT